MPDSDRQGSANRRTVLRTGALVAGVGLAGCFGGGGGGDSLHYVGRGGVTQESFRELLGDWEDENDVTVEHTSVADDTEMMSVISENPGSIDFCNPSSGGFTRGRNEDLFAELDYEALPNYQENIDDPWHEAQFLEGHDDGTFRYISTQGLAYNTERVDEFSSWAEIEREEYADQISLHSVAFARFANAAAAAEVPYSQIADDQESYDAIMQKARDQHENVFNYWTSGSQQMQFLREEQALISSAWGGRVRSLQQDGHPIEYFIPDEGAVTHSEGYAIAESSENKELVHELLNWVYQRNNLVELSTATGYPAPMPDPPSEVTDLPDYTEHPDDLVWVDWPKIFPMMQDLQEAFNEIRSS